MTTKAGAQPHNATQPRLLAPLLADLAGRQIVMLTFSTGQREVYDRLREEYPDAATTAHVLPEIMNLDLTVEGVELRICFDRDQVDAKAGATA